LGCRGAVDGVQALSGQGELAERLVLSHYQAGILLKARAAGEDAAVASPDLGLTDVDVALSRAGAQFPGRGMVGWEALEEIAGSENSCFLVERGEPVKIQAFSELTGRYYSLMPTERAPTMLISGIPMHRIKGTDPYRDTLTKIATLKPVIGNTLDTATGLGYTAIEAAKTADHVLTVELDPTALAVARLNPWSQALFGGQTIEQRIGDSFDVVETLEEGVFQRIIHDPPTFSLAGHLYSGDFYAELHRVLARGGRLFHYIGDPGSPTGRSTTRGVIERLRQAGFGRVVRRPQAFGVVAYR
jgi:predicted methyltransferase